MTLAINPQAITPHPLPSAVRRSSADERNVHFMQLTTDDLEVLVNALHSSAERRGCYTIAESRLVRELKQRIGKRAGL